MDNNNKDNDSITVRVSALYNVIHTLTLATLDASNKFHIEGKDYDVADLICTNQNMALNFLRKDSKVHNC